MTATYTITPEELRVLCPPWRARRKRSFSGSVSSSMRNWSSTRDGACRGLHRRHRALRLSPSPRSRGIVTGRPALPHRSAGACRSPRRFAPVFARFRRAKVSISQAERRFRGILDYVGSHGRACAEVRSWRTRSSVSAAISAIAPVDGGALRALRRAADCRIVAVSSSTARRHGARRIRIVLQRLCGSRNDAGSRGHCLRPVSEIERTMKRVRMERWGPAPSTSIS